MSFIVHRYKSNRSSPGEVYTYFYIVPRVAHWTPWGIISFSVSSETLLSSIGTTDVSCSGVLTSKTSLIFEKKNRLILTGEYWRLTWKLFYIHRIDNWWLISLPSARTTHFAKSLARIKSCCFNCHSISLLKKKYEDLVIIGLFYNLPSVLGKIETLFFWWC